MTTVEVFDPPMCCSTGVCGPSVDPALATFAADLQWAGENGARVARYNLAQEPGRFAGHDAVRALLAEGGEEVLPVVVVDGEVRSSGRYPARAEIGAWTLPSSSPADVLDEATASPEALTGARRDTAATAAPGPAPASADACCGREAPGPLQPAETAARQLTVLPVLEAAEPCCGGTAEGSAAGAADQTGCCG